jgi:transcriptional regulator with XRE-family HTH domain
VDPAPKIRQVQLVGGKIRRLRKERRLTQTELSARIGVQQSDLSRMEKGEYRVSLDTLFRILAEFDVSVGEFFDEGAREALTPRQARLASDLRALDPVARGEVESFIAFKRRQEQHQRLHHRQETTNGQPGPGTQLDGQPPLGGAEGEE